MKLLLKIAFLGTHYNGYQVQPDAPSVQAVLNETALRLFGFACDIVGCSRTDSGVSAESFYATFCEKGKKSIGMTVPLSKLPLAMNSLLPPDISVLGAMYVPEDFHARYDVVSKTYEYRIWNGKVKNPFLADRAMDYRRPLTDEKLAAMKEAAAYFVGKYDFCAFMARGSKVASTIRTVYSSEVRREGEMVVFRVEADGFLYNMVRIMVGTLLEVAEGRLSPGEIPDVIESRDRTRAGKTAVPFGLCLSEVRYPFEFREET